MNIDFRNVPEETEKAINKYKEKKEVKTTVEAVQRMLENYHGLESDIKHWETRALDAEKEIQEIKFTFKHFKKLLKAQ